MPTYDYICDACKPRVRGVRVDQSRLPDPLPELPQAPTLRRKIGGGAAILFKGSGFYQTDYRSESYKTSAKADKAPEAATGGGSKSDSSTTPPTTPAKSSDSGGSSSSSSSSSTGSAS